MNVSLNPGQTNTRVGDLQFPGSVNLTGCENLLWKVVNNGGVANFALPTNVADRAVYIGASGDVAGNYSAAESPNLGENCRILLDGTCNPGDQLALSPNIWGRLYVPPAGTGNCFCNWVAEEAGVAGQLLRVRRVPERIVNF